MFQQRIYRFLGLSARLGWARLVIDRTKAKSATPAPATAQAPLTPLKTTPLRMRTLPTAIAPLLLHTCKSECNAVLWAGHQTKHNMGAAFCDTVRSAPNNCCTDGVVRKVVLQGGVFCGAGHCC